MLILPCVHFGALKNHGFQRGMEVAQDRDIPIRGVHFRPLHPLDLCKCKMCFCQESLRCHTILHPKTWGCFPSQKDSINTYMLFLGCKSKRFAEKLCRKVLACFWKGSTNSDYHGSIELFILMNLQHFNPQAIVARSWVRSKLPVTTLKNLLFEFAEIIQRHSAVKAPSASVELW